MVSLSGRAGAGLLILLAVGLAGCRGTTSQAAQAGQVWDALESPACDLPCWHQVRPGGSTPAEVEAALLAQDFIAGVECFTVPPEDLVPENRFGAFCTWESRAGYPLWGGVFQFGRDAPNRLEQSFITLRRPVSFEEAVSHFGEPGAVWGINHTGQAGACRCSENHSKNPAEGGIDLDLLYPEIGLILSAQQETVDQWPCLCGTMWIDSVTLGQPAGDRDLDGWWRLNFDHGLAEEGGQFLDFPGWETPFE